MADAASSAQPSDGVGHLLGHDDSLLRISAGELGARLVDAATGLGDDVGDAVAQDLGLGVARTHRIDRDALPRHLERQRAGEADHPVLRGQ